MAGSGAALARANAALASTQQTLALASVAGPGGLGATMVPASVNLVMVRDYFGDGRELNAGARWQRAASQSAGIGRRQSGDGAWWQIAEAVIDPCMLGARASDRTTDSTAAIREALGFANGNYPGFAMSGGRTVRFNPPPQVVAGISGNANLSGAYCISGELTIPSDGRLEIAAGAELFALPGFSGSFMLSTPDTGNWAIGGGVYLDGTLNGNSVASGIGLRSGAGYVINTMHGQMVNLARYGVQLGDPVSGTYSVYQCKLLLGAMYTTPVTTYAAAQNANDPASIGIWLTGKASDNRILNGEPVGFRTGYQDDGADNDMSGVHPYTTGSSNPSHPTFFGPMTTAFALNGGSASISAIEADTPTSMGNPAISAVYGLLFGPNATGYRVRGYQCFLNYDDNYASAYSSGLCNAIQFNSNDQLGTNSVDGALFDAADPAIKYQYGLGGANTTFFVRRGVTVSAKATFTGFAFSDYMSVANRPDIRPTMTASRRHNWLDNCAFAIWQRGTSISVGASAGTAVFGPDRWSSLSDGTGTRTISQLGITVPEANGFYELQAAQAMQISQSAASGCSYWRIEQKLPASYLFAFAVKRMTLRFAIKLVSGTLPTTIKVGLRQSFGTGGSADALVEYPIANAPGPTYARQFVTVTWPSLMGATIGTNPLASIYFSLPVTGTYAIAITEVMLTEGTEQCVFDYPDDADELRKAQRYYEVVNAVTINGTQFVPCQPKAGQPTCTATTGALGTITPNGALLTGSGSSATQLIFVASEP